jgi:hypothetical protein
VRKIQILLLYRLCTTLQSDKIYCMYCIYFITLVLCIDGSIKEFLSLTSTLDGGGWVTPRLGHFTPGKERRYPLYRRQGGPQGRSGEGAKSLGLTGIRSADLPARSKSLHLLSYTIPPLYTIITHPDVTQDYGHRYGF